MRAGFGRFNRGFEWLSDGYGRLTGAPGARRWRSCVVVYVGADRLSPASQFARAPTGFIPEQDQGYLITVLQLPPGASLDAHRGRW